MSGSCENVHPQAARDSTRYGGLVPAGYSNSPWAESACGQAWSP